MPRPKEPPEKKKGQVTISAPPWMMKYVLEEKEKGELWESKAQAFRVAMREYMAKRGKKVPKDDID